MNKKYWFLYLAVPLFPLVLAYMARCTARQPEIAPVTPVVVDVDEGVVKEPAPDPVLPTVVEVDEGVVVEPEPISLQTRIVVRMLWNLRMQTVVLRYNAGDRFILVDHADGTEMLPLRTGNTTASR